MANYFTRHVAVTAAVQVANAVTTKIDGAAAQDFVLPGGTITKILAAITRSALVATTGTTLSLRLGGGIPAQDIALGALSEDTTTTGGTKYSPLNLIPVSIPLPAAGVTVVAQVFQNGVDPGTPELDITLEVS